MVLENQCFFCTEKGIISICITVRKDGLTLGGKCFKLCEKHFKDFASTYYLKDECGNYGENFNPNLFDEEETED